MSMHRILTAALLLWTTDSLAKEPSGNDSRAVDRAREALSKKLEEAKSEGVISIKGQKTEITDNREDERGAINSPTIPRPKSLRDDYNASADCLTLSSLVTAAAAAADDPLGRIDKLMQTAADDGNTERHWINSRLAETYLAIGFFDEAYAVSSKVDGPRGVATSILAATALGADVKMSKKPLLTEQCGRLHQLAEKISHASGPLGLNVEASDLQFIASLPSPVAESVLDYISVAAIDQGKLDVADLAREARKRIANGKGKTEAQSYADAAILLAERPSIESAETLLSISTDPGPLRGDAIKHLVMSGAAELLSSEDQSALLANMEDAQAAIAAGDWNASFGDALIDFRLKSGDWLGALDLLGQKLVTSKNTDLDALTAFTKILDAKLLGENKDDALSALAFMAANTKIVAETLNGRTFEEAAKELSQLGAVEILDELLLFRATGERDFVSLRGNARLRSGKFDALNEFISGRENDAEMLELIAARTFEYPRTAMPKFPAKIVSVPKAAETIARMAWARGDWRTAANLFRSASEISPSKELHERAALALLASDATTEVDEAEWIQYARGSDSVLAHFFLPAPAADSGAAVREFASGVAQEIEYIRKRNVQ